MGAAHGAWQLRAAGTQLVGRDGVPARPGKGACPVRARPRQAAARGELPRGRVAPAGAGPAVLGQLRGRRLRHSAPPRHRRRHRRDAASGHQRARRARLTTMNVLMISPGYPAEMAFFTRGLAAAGASVIGVGDQPGVSVPALARDDVAARPPARRQLAALNFATDAARFSAWAQAVSCGRIWQPIERRYNTASIFKRAEGAGRISHYQGLAHLLAEYGEQVAAVELLPVGAPRRDWRAVSISDGMVIVRHPELSWTIEMADRFASDLHLYAE